MGIEQRKHPRYGVHLAVKYTNAEQFVNDYVENLSIGGLFIAGANQLPLLSETDVNIVLPGQGDWTVRARAVFIIDETAAKATGRKPGAGMEIISKPPGFDDALLGYLLRLGHRRDHSVMIGDVPGMRHIIDAGYRTIPLEPADEAARTVGDALVKLVAILLPPEQCDAYRARIGERGKALVFAVTNENDMHDILARIDSML